MALKPVTLRLDEEEYEKLKKFLSAYGDPDMSAAYVVRAYIRDLNRALPFLSGSGWDLKNFFALYGVWLKRMMTVPHADMVGKSMSDWGQYWASFMGLGGSENGSTSEPDQKAPEPQEAAKEAE